MMELIDLSNMWVWFAVALVMFALEIMVPTVFVFLPLGIGALVAGLSTMVAPDLDLVHRLIIAGVGMVVATGAGIIWGQRFGGRARLNFGARRLVGTVVRLDKPIEHGDGWVSLGGSLWRVRGPSLPVGAWVEVAETDGNTLVVRPAPAPEGA